MSIAMKSVDEVVAEDLKRDGFWFVFNSEYNSTFAFKDRKLDSPFFSTDATNSSKRDEFLDFMSAQFPSVELIDVLDLMPTEYLEWGYLGSIMVDIVEGNDAYKALCGRYGSPEDDPIDRECVFWKVSADFAKDIYDKRRLLIDDL